MNATALRLAPKPEDVIETDPLAHLRELAASVPPGVEGDTVLEEAGDAGRHYREDMDAGRWVLGDIAVFLQDRYPNFQDSYGEQVVASFAREIASPKRTVYEYAETARFYPDRARRALSSGYPMLAYSHYRAAMRLTTPAERRQDPNGALARALTFLTKCADKGWTADEAYVASKEERGGGNKPLVDQVFEALAHDGGVYFWLGSETKVKAGKSYRVVINEVTS